MSNSAAQVSPLFILAMDHRDSLARKVYKIDGEPDAAQMDRLRAGKELVFRGLQVALGRAPATGQAAVLVDERYGAAVAREAAAAGLTVAMPIEHSGEEWFTPEYGRLSGSEWMEHVGEFKPDYVKVLVRDNPQFDAVHRHAQMADLASVSRRLRSADRRMLLELLVPATAGQQSSTYDADVRPELTEQVMTDFQEAGVEPDIWKIEGLDTSEAAVRIVAVAQQGGRSAVRCIVLGRDAPQDDLDRWLTVAAGVPGFCGFAIGRSIWEEPLSDHLSGRADEQATADEIASRYLHFVTTWQSADHTHRTTGGSRS